jgi:hypothetical protein
MRLQLLLAADCANLTGDGKLNIMGVFNQINAVKFPAKHPSMYLIIKLEAELGEYGKTKDIAVLFQDEDGKQILELSATAKVPSGGGGRRPEVNLILNFPDLIFPTPGAYQFVILANQEYKGDLTIYANQIDSSKTE